MSVQHHRIGLPKTYRHPIIICSLLREKLEEWNFESVKRELRGNKIRDNDIEVAYYEEEKNFTTLEQFCSNQPFQFFVKTVDGIQTMSEGPAIYFDSQKKQLFFKKFQLYSIPPGIKAKLTTVHEFLTYAESVDRGTDTDWSMKQDWAPHAPLTWEDIQDIEILFFIRIRVWTRSFCKRENRPIYNFSTQGIQLSWRTCACTIKKRQIPFY